MGGNGLHLIQSGPIIPNRDDEPLPTPVPARCHRWEFVDIVNPFCFFGVDFLEREDTSVKLPTSPTNTHSHSKLTSDDLPPTSKNPRSVTAKQSV